MIKMVQQQYCEEAIGISLEVGKSERLTFGAIFNHRRANGSHGLETQHLFRERECGYPR